MARHGFWFIDAIGIWRMQLQSFSLLQCWGTGCTVSYSNTTEYSYKDRKKYPGPLPSYIRTLSYIHHTPDQHAWKFWALWWLYSSHGGCRLVSFCWLRADMQCLWPHTRSRGCVVSHTPTCLTVQCHPAIHAYRNLDPSCFVLSALRLRCNHSLFVLAMCIVLWFIYTIARAVCSLLRT